MLLNGLGESSLFARLCRAVSLEAVASNAARDMIYDAAAEMIAEAEKFSMRGDLWELFFAMSVILGENPICRAYERRAVPQDIFRILASDLWVMHERIVAVKSMIDADDRFAPLRGTLNFEPRNADGAFMTKHTYGDVAFLAKEFAAAQSSETMGLALGSFCAKCGIGKFAMDCAFTWNSLAKTLVPVNDADPCALNALIGCDRQKEELLANTESFVSGIPTNNVLLFGDSGSGKSSSVRALLNEPGFISRGLRIIEIRHDQFGEIPDLLNLLRGRNYRFILFMDDLSFEEFEVSYKYLKALIEGGLERKPGNVVIYATSNRRHIIREVWGDRSSSPDDVHGWDTMQEKLSLADRFGVTIWYPSVSKDDYLVIVKSVAAEMGLTMDAAEMEKLAMRWELERGGFTGRAARQFVHQMLQRKAK